MTPKPPQPPARRLRLDHFVIQPVLRWDDGTELSAGPEIQPAALTLAGLQELIDNWPAKLAEIETQAGP